MKKILLLVVMLSIILFSVGSAYAFIGVNDDVPGQDVVVPFVCEDTHLIDYTLLPDTTFGSNTGVDDGTLNTLWAIAEVTGFPTTATIHIFNTHSQFITDSNAAWTAHDVVNSDCQTLIGSLAPAFREGLATVITANGVKKIVYAGYLTFINTGISFVNPPATFPPVNQLISWVYQVDMPNGFSAAYNGYDVEGGLDKPAGFPFTTPSHLNENGTPGIPVAAGFLMPRYFFLNTDPGTFNWWYVLKGGPVNPLHILNGIICNEEEECQSQVIPVPNNLNIIDVALWIPTNIFHDTVIQEHTDMTDTSNSVKGISAGETAHQGGGFAVFATQTGSSAGFFNGTPPFVSSMGWSYQRAKTGGVITNWDVFNPIHALHESQP